MGRWAQRRRTGGGPTVFNYMLAIGHAGNFDTLAEYAYNINSLTLSPAAFASIPSAHVPTGIVQSGVKRVDIQWADSQAAETGLTYSGTTPAIRTPQTISY